MKSSFLKTLLVAIAALILSGCASAVPVPPAETPSPIAINLLDGKSGVPVDSTFKYTFSQPVITSTVNTQTYFIVPSPVPASFEETCNVEIALDAAVSCTTDMECFLQPVSNLEYNTPYAICLTTDILYQTMERFEGFAVRFTTEETGPVDINSLHGATNVPIDSSFRYRFTNMPDKNSVSASTFFLVPDTSGSLSPTTTFSEALCNLANAIPAEIACTDWSCTLTPVNLLTNATNYAVCLSSAIHYIGAIAKSIEYIEPIFDFEGFMAQFATVSGAGPEPTPVIPTVTAKIVRLDGTKLNLTDRPIPLRISIEFTISEAITKPEDRAKFESAVTLLDNLGSKVNGAFVWGADGFTVVFTPNVTLNYRTQYTIAVDQEMLPIFDLSKSPIDTSMKFVTMTRGDITGDGVPDVAIHMFNPPSYEGKVYIFSGAALRGNLDTSQAVAQLHGTTGENNHFGEGMWIKDDLNDDGYADLIVSAYGSNGFYGALYVFGGKDILDDIDKQLGPNDALSAFVASGEFWLTGNIEGMGDMDGDGIEDFIITAVYSDWATFYYGRAYLFSGTVLPHLTSFDDAMAMVQGTVLDYFGFSPISGAGDIDQDGVQDIMLSDNVDYFGTLSTVYVMSGADLTMTTTTDDAIAKIHGERPGKYFGRTLFGGYDLDKDSVPDVITGTPFYPDIATSRGITNYFSGEALLNCPAPPCEWNQSDSSSTIFGENDGDNYGVIVESIGDLTGDGITELILSSQLYNSESGIIYLFSGAEFPTATSLSEALTTIQGKPASRLSVTSGIGDIDGDNIPDTCVGASKADSERGEVYVFSGATLTSTHSTDDAIATISGGATDKWFGTGISGVGNN